MISNKVTLLLFAVVLCGVASAVQPGCRTRYEMRTKWTVQDNNSRFWHCHRWGLAVQTSCPPGTLFSQPFQTCVPARHWEEYPYYPPPSAAHEDTDECEAAPVECVDSCAEVECEGGIVIDNECVCNEEGFVVQDGTCAAVVACPEGSVNKNGECVTCEGGQWVEEECVCYGDSVWVDGICMTQPGEIDGCENGQWNAIENYCVCNEGFEMVDGRCVVVGSVGICDGAPDSAYEVKGTWNCDAPDCTNDEYWANIHFPTRNPRTFWQCESIGARPTEMPCGAGTCFSPDHQVCIHARDWVNPCM